MFLLSSMFVLYDIQNNRWLSATIVYVRAFRLKIFPKIAIVEE